MAKQFFESEEAAEEWARRMRKRMIPGTQKQVPSCAQKSGAPAGVPPIFLLFLPPGCEGRGSGPVKLRRTGKGGWLHWGHEAQWHASLFCRRAHTVSFAALAAAGVF